MPDAEMREDYRSKRDEFFLGFPNASVTSQGYISYMDMAWRQVDFYILDKKRDKSYLEGMVYSRDLFGDYVKKDKKLRLLLTRDENGLAYIDKGNPFGLSLYVEQGDKVVQIHKQAFSEGEFEDGFRHIIETFHFRK